MAGEWIKMRWCLSAEPEVLQMADILGVSVQHVLGCLFQFWSWADQHLERRNGDAPNVTKKRIDALVSTSGFGDALEIAGWLRSKDAGVLVPKYEIHMGQRGKTKALTSERNKKYRVKKERRSRDASGVTFSSSYSSSCSSSDSSSGTEEEHGDIQDFEVWWAAAPKKVGKLKARKAYAAARKLATAETLLAAITAFAASPKARGEFCPHPTTWLNEGRWEDDPATWLDASQGNRKPKPKTLQELMT